MPSMLLVSLFLAGTTAALCGLAVLVKREASVYQIARNHRPTGQPEGRPEMQKWDSRRGSKGRAREASAPAVT